MGADTGPELAGRLDAWKARLIDLGKRNRLLYFRETRRGTLPLNNVGLDGLWSHVSRDGAEMVFVSEDAPEAPDGGARERRAGEAALTVQTSLSEADLERTLTNLYRKSRESVAELGVHTLYLALGLLHWCESESSDEEIRSPLVLVPVELVRRKGGGMSLRSLDEPPVANIALAEKLRRDFSLELPNLGASETQPLNLSAYLERVEDVAKDLPRGEVRRSSVLAILSFVKLVMYEDLRRNTERALSHPVVRALCGALPDQAEWDVPSGGRLDCEVPYDASYEVLDADSSQREAIGAARAGRSFVLVGPPGTGKSQTIANLMAAMVADGKRVLFVSEKAAALEVVLSRLQECGLSEFCLDLHRFRGDKRAILGQLEARLRATDGPRAVASVDLHQAEACRSQLNEYAHALHEPFGAAQKTPYEMHGTLAELAEAPDLEFTADGAMAGLGSAWFGQVNILLGDVASLARVYAEGQGHPWWGFRYAVGDPKTRGELRRALQRLRESAERAVEVAEQVAKAIGVSVPCTLDHAARLARAVGLVESLHPGVAQPAWADRGSLEDDANHAGAACEAAAALTSARGTLAETYRDSLYAVDLRAVCQRFDEYRRSWWRRLLGARRDVDALRGHAHEGAARRRFREWAADVDRMREAMDLERWFASKETELRAAAGEGYGGLGTDWRLVMQDLATVAQLKTALGGECTSHWLGECMQRLGDTALVPEGRGEELTKEVKRAGDFAGYFRGCFSEESDPFGGIALRGLSAEGLGEWAERHLVRFNEIEDWAELARVAKRARELGVGSFHEALLGHPEAVPEARGAFYKRVCHLWLAEAYATRPALSQFGLARMEQLVRMFRELDLGAVKCGAERTRRRAREGQRPASQLRASGQLAVLKHEIGKQRRHKPMRQLLQEIPELVQALTPCMLMSPLSVSQYLASDRLQFDLVIFDEGSQVKPEDAITAVMRGDGLVVAGDPKQLPPTDFFEASLLDDYDDDASGEAPLDSVLDECMTWMPEVLLKWHYRSRDDSLIAFSNHHFYDNRLVTFPNASCAERELGLFFEHCARGVYDRGKSRTNRTEARQVAALVGRLRQRYPNDSLGVVALSQAQQEAIYEAIQELARTDPLYEGLLAANDDPEGFFVKNLETVQGDERDTIILSIGYGRDQTGQLTMHFGPLNKTGGERRLNVAVTRARNRVVIVSSITAADMPRTASQGPTLLRSYLEYAEKGPPALVSGADGGLGDVESPFEDAVRRALVGKGLEVRAQVGCSAYRVDLAVVDPGSPGRYLIGIECDGSSYHSARTARDRDRLRQQVLEGLGWRIMRIWSTDWVRNPDRQIERVLQEVTMARERLEVQGETAALATPSDRPGADPSTDAPAGFPDESATVSPLPPDEPVARLAEDTRLEAVGESQGVERHVYEVAELGTVGRPERFYALASDRHPDVLLLVRRVAEAESPVHRDVVAKRLASAFGMEKCGPRIGRLVQGCIAAASRRGFVRIERDFVWRIEERPVVVRTNAGAAEPRVPEHIAPEEARQAVLDVVSASFGVTRDECVVEVARAFGFERTGKKIREWVGRALDAALRDGAVEIAGEQTLVLAPR